ncbi:MAG: SMP-30/gluconolactonase/LRE family protein [Pseudomonadota bacterium]
MTFSFTTGGETILPTLAASVFFDGLFTDPKLSHPEGVAVGPDGWIWAANENGQIFKITPDGDAFEVVFDTGGFALGLAFEGDRALFICDLQHAAVFRFDLKSRALERWGADGLRIPNYPLVDAPRGRLLVSDSHASGTPGPGVWAFDLVTGEGSLWCDAAMNFANGLAMRSGEDALYVCETFARSITRIPILPDGSAGAPEPFATDLPGLPDGIAFDCNGELVVGCYEPSRLLRIGQDGNRVDVLIEDVTAHTFCHPTNIAFAGDRLFTANLGRWHLAEVAMDVGAPPLWEASM